MSAAPHLPAPPGQPIVAAAAEPPMDMNEGAALAEQPVQEVQEMDQDHLAARNLAGHCQAAVVNRMDPRAGQLVPYVSLSSDDDSSDEEGKTLLNIQYSRL